jgi:bromodomain-containing factor 1
VARASRALQQLLQHPAAPPFGAPVPRSVPLYYDIIKRPMDLGTVLSRLQRGGYGGPGALLEDIALVWQNCRLYNEPGSEIVQAAATLEALWATLVPPQQLFADAGMVAAQHAAPAAAQVQQRVSPVVAAQAHRAAPVQDAMMAAHHAWPPQATMGHIGHAVAHGTMPQHAVAAAHPAAVAQVHHQPHPMMPDQATVMRQLGAMAQVLHKLQTYERAQPFMTPVPREVQGYYEVIKRPMDLGTIWAKLRGGQYRRAEECHADVQQVWRNCFTFNVEQSDIYQAAVQCEGVYRRLCQQAGLM